MLDSQLENRRFKVEVPTNGNWSLHYVNAVSGVRTACGRSQLESRNARSRTQGPKLSMRYR